MNIQQLRCFVAVAELENMSRAAERLHITQSALSKNIAKLESELGVALFVRNGKKIELNAAGAGFLRCCSAILRTLDKGLEELRLAAGGGDRRLRIGSSGASGDIMRCIAAFSHENPGTEFDWNSGIDAEEHIDINDYDILIYPYSRRYEKFSGYPLGRERYYLAVSAAHPLCSAGSVTLQHLEGLDFVFLRSGRDTPEAVYGLCTALALRFGSQCFADTRELHRRMVSSGIAVGFVPEGEADSYRADKNIRLLPISDARFSREMMICFKREKHLSETARAFKEFAVRFLHLHV